MIIDHDGDKLTPTQAAKLILMYGADIHAEGWEENETVVESDSLTAPERKKIEKQLRRQLARVQRTLRW